jgi:hypothetical protein
VSIQSTQASGAAGTALGSTQSTVGTGAAGTGQGSTQSTLVGSTGSAETVILQGGGAAGAGAGAGTGQLANTGAGPIGIEALLGALLTVLGAALLKPREVWRRFVR